MGGLNYEETPIRDELISPEFIDANSIGASAGLSYQLTPRFALEAAYAFSYGQQRLARANPLNATVSNVGGAYRTAANTASIGLAVAF